MLDENITGRNVGSYGYGGGMSDFIALFAIMALFGGRGFGFGGHGDDRDGGLKAYEYMHNDNVNSRFNSLQNQTDFNGVNGHLNSIQSEVGRLGFDNAMIAKNAEIAALQCCCETNGNIRQMGFDNAMIAKNAEIAALGCCCETNRNIDSVKVQMAQDTCAIIANAKDLAKDAELREAYARINQQNTELSEQRIVSTILSTLQPPRPVPAYAAANPYEQYVAPVRVVAPQPHCNPFNNCGNAFA